MLGFVDFRWDGAEDWIGVVRVDGEADDDGMDVLYCRLVAVFRQNSVNQVLLYKGVEAFCQCQLDIGPDSLVTTACDGCDGCMVLA